MKGRTPAPVRFPNLHGVPGPGAVVEEDSEVAGPRCGLGG